MPTETVLDFEGQVICVGHMPPQFSIKDAKMLFLCEQDIGVPNSWVFGEKHPDLLRYGYTLSEYSALFALRRRLSEEGNIPQRIILTQYRKFVSNHDIGRISKNINYVNTVASKELMIGKNDLVPLAGDILVSKPLALPGRVIDQYNAFHILRDLMAFVVDAIDGGVINNPAACAVIDSRYLIPAPTLGCYDGKTFLEIFSILELAASRFISGSYIKRDGYQRRVLGFCLERLHSAILLTRLDFPNCCKDKFGCQVVISDSDIVKATV